jgi:hypothetical protein
VLARCRHMRFPFSPDIRAGVPPPAADGFPHSQS